MAKKSLMSDIANELKEINTSTKQFGTKLPGDGNKEKENQEEELNMLDLILGSYAALIWGQKSKKGKDIRTLLNQRSLFNVVTDVGVNVENVKKGLSKISEQISTIYRTLDKSYTEKDGSKLALRINIDRNNFDKIFWTDYNKQNKDNNEKLEAFLKKDILEKYTDWLAKTFIKTFGKESLIIGAINDNGKTLKEKLDKVSNKIKSKGSEAPNIDTSELVTAIQDLTLETSSVDTNVQGLQELHKKLIETINKIDHEILVVKSSLGIEINSSESLNELLDYINDNKNVLIVNVNGSSLDEFKTKLDDLQNYKIELSGLDDLKTKLEEIQKDYEINVTGLDTLTDTVERLTNALAVKKEAFDWVKNVGDALSKLNFEQVDATKAAEKLNNIETILTGRDSKGSIKAVYDALVSLKLDSENSINNAEQLFVTLKYIIDVLNVDTSSINPKSFKALAKVLGKDGSIYEIINNLDELSLDAKKERDTALRTLDSFINTLTNVTNISPIKVLKSKLSLRLIDKLLLSEIKDLIKKLSNVADIATKDSKSSFDALVNFFEAVSKIGEINLSNRRKMVRNIMFVNEFLNDDIKGIFKTLRSIAFDAKKTKEDQELLTLLIDNIIKIADIDKAKLKESKDNIINIEDYIKNDIKELFDEILKIENTKKVGKILNDINSIMSDITDLNEDLPGFMSILAGQLKIAGIGVETSLIHDVIDVINSFNKVSKNSVNILNKDFPNVLDNIIVINNLLNTIKYVQAIKDIAELLVLIKQYDGVLNKLLILNDKYPDEIKFVGIKKSLQNINKVNSWLKDSYQSEIDKLSNLSQMLISLADLFVVFENTNLNGKDIDKVTSILKNNFYPLVQQFEEKSELATSLSKMMEIKNSDLSKVENIVKLLDEYSKVAKITAVAKFSIKGIKAYIKAADYIKTIIDKLSSIKQEDIDAANKSIKMFTKLVVASAFVLIFGSIAMTFVDPVNLILFTATLGLFLWGVSAVFSKLGKGLKQSLEGAKGAVLLILGAGLVLVLGSKLMDYVAPINLILFTATLGLFLWGVSAVFYKFSKGYKDAMHGAEDAVILIAASGFIMLLGGALTKFIDPAALVVFIISLTGFLLGVSFALSLVSERTKNLMGTAEDLALIIGISGAILIFGGLVGGLVGIAPTLLFALELTVLITAVMGVYILASNFVSDAMNTAKDIAWLIGVSGLVLIAAGVLANYIKFGWLALFILELTVLIGGVLAIYIFAGQFFKSAIQGAKELALLIGMSGLVLILAGLVVDYINIGKLALFTLILAAFIGAILFVYSLASVGFKQAFKGAKEFAILIAVSAIILIAGAKIVEEYIDIPSLILFTVLLAGFIFVTTFVYSHFAKDIRKAFLPALGLALVTAISGLVLMMGANYILENPGIEWAAVKFILVLIGYIAAMGTAMFILGKIWKDLLIGSGVMVVLIGVTTLAALVINLIAGIASQEGFLMNILKGVGAIALVITAIGGIAFAAGALVSGPQALIFAAGVAAMTTVAGVAYVAAKAVSAIADAMIRMKEVEEFDASIMINNIKGFISIAEEMEPISKAFPVIMKASLAISAMSYALSAIGKTMKDWADLKIPIYLGTEIVGYETITSDAFGKAAENIKQVVVTLAQAVIDVYNEKPELFDVSFGDLLTGGSKFSKVAKSLKTMGPMLSEIAKAVKDWSKLTIPVYTGTEITGYETITSDAFGKAAENIKKVVVTLGQAVIDVYNEAPEGMFDSDSWFGFGDSKFAKVSKALKTMGPMLSSIAKAIKDWADLKIPVYEGEKIIGYETITGSQFTTAANNIKQVVKTLGQAIIETYDECEKNDSTKGMFDPQGFLGLGKSKFARVTQAFKTMGPMLTEIAEGVKNWADLKIPEYKGTEIVGYKTIKDKEFEYAAENIKKVLTCIGQALVEVVEANPKIFGENIFTDSPAINAAKAMKLMGETLALSATAVGSYAANTFPVFDKEGKYVKDIIVKETDYEVASQNIHKVLVCIGNALSDIVNNSDIFNEGLFQDSPAAIAATAIKDMSEALNNSVDAIAKLAELNMDEMHAALDPNGAIDNVYHRLKDLLNFTVEIYKFFAEPDESQFGRSAAFLWWGNNPMSFAEYLDDHNGDIEDANEALGTFTDMLNNVIKNFTKIGTAITDNKDPLSVFVGGTSSPVYTYIKDSMNSITSIIKLLTNETTLDLFEEIDDNYKDISKGIESTSKVILGLVTKVKNIYDVYKDIKDFGLTKLITLIHSFRTAVAVLKTLESSNEGNNIDIKMPTVDTVKLTQDINMLTNSLSLMIKVAEYAEQIGENGYNILRDGIIKIYATTSVIQQNHMFSEHVKDLEKYIQAINSIKLNNIRHLTSLVDSMNELSRRLGNLDDLTDAISTNLSQVLYELVLQLRKAEQTITNAHELQEKRKKLMEESITKIETIMDKHMIVEISQINDNEDNPTPTGNINSNPTSDGRPTGTDTESPSMTQSAPNPEDATANNGSQRRGNGNNDKVDRSKYKDLLTYDQFKNYMERDFINKFKS